MSDLNHYADYLDSLDLSESQEFLEKGYIIKGVEDKRSLNHIRDFLLEILDSNLGEPDKLSKKNDLNSLHENIEADRLNTLRLSLIDQLNQEAWLRPEFFRLTKNAIFRLIGNELAMQRYINLSIQMPGDSLSTLPMHADVWSGDSPYEVVAWLPLVNCYKTKSMFILPPKKTQVLHEDFELFKKSTPDKILRTLWDDLEWIKIDYGQILLFNQNLPHGNTVNDESETRWSLNCRFKSILSPYRDKKLGEFFDPITPRAATLLGMRYKFPHS
jgi:sporadic carbohydrate cluster 2OG-Fe(II) oxygenase